MSDNTAPDAAPTSGPIASPSNDVVVETTDEIAAEAPEQISDSEPLESSLGAEQPEAHTESVELMEPVEEVEVAAADADAHAVDPANEPTPDAAPEAGGEASLDDDGVLPYQPGDIVPGVVTAVRPDGMDVELDSNRRAVVPKAEMVSGAAPAVGDTMEGQIIRRQGNLRYVISPRRAARARSWTRLLAAFESGDVVTGAVVEATKGGLIVDLGLRAFLPESLIDVRRVNKPAELIGQQVSVVVIECTKNADRPGERIVVSRKPIREKERAQSRQQLMGEITVGDRRRGRISALVPFGAFVDLGGVEGLIHVSELAHRQVAKPDDVVSVGDDVDVVVLEVNTEKRKIALSRKRALPDPWNSFQTRHQVGDLVFGTVTGLAPFGVFIALEGEELEGLVHISELSRFRVEEASEVVNVGEGVWVKILEIAPDKKRLALSLRRALE